jgi:GT2 family glycosyltransferase
MSDPRASVIVLNWDGLEYLGPCLDAVLAQDYDNFEVIVVDNGSTDGSVDFVTESYPQAVLLCNKRNLGFSAANNRGLRTATGDLLVLLNNDTEVHPNWLRALASTAADPGVGIVGAKALYPDGRLQHAGGFVGKRGAASHYGYKKPDDGQFDRTREVDYVTGASLAITRKALETIGELDEGFTPIYYEDLDWCFRARAAGLRVVYQPRAKLIHHESATTASFNYEQMFALNLGRLRFVFKHWAVDRLLTEFGPAELEWVVAMDRNEELMTARRAYLHTILALRGILDFRRSSPQEADALLGLLSNLRSATLASLAAMGAAGGPSDSHWPSVRQDADRERAELLDNLRAIQTIRERPFTSEVPVFGKLIVGIRNLWNSVAAKWYVRPMLHQQNVFNQQVVNHLHDFGQDLLELEQRLQVQARDVTENIRELTILAERIADIKDDPQA